jgi:hypothetical protein
VGAESESPWVDAKEIFDFAVKLISSAGVADEVMFEASDIINFEASDCNRLREHRGVGGCCVVAGVHDQPASSAR